MTKQDSHWFPRISSAVFYERPGDAIDWLCAAFGFTVRERIGEGNQIVHSELLFGDDGLIMVTNARGRGRDWQLSAEKTGGCTQALCIYVDDVEAHYLRACRAGATIVSAPKDSDFGPGYWVDRSYECVDLEGHHWWFCQRLRSNPPA